MTAYYNEIDPFAAQWLRNLIAAGVIAPGDVDERDIRDVRPSDIAGYTQAHWFAGIGVWSYAARLAGWPDDRSMWSGSCPCQPFSAAGKGDGFDDERHLWPDWHHLIRICRPAVVFGEQVASKDGYAWLDLVQADMEGVAYALGPHVSPSAGFGAPHERHRIRFAGVALGDSARQRSGTGFRDREPSRVGRVEFADAGSVGFLDNNNTRLEGHAGDGYDAPRWALPYRPTSKTGLPRSMAHGDNTFGRADDPRGYDTNRQDAGRQEGPGDLEGRGRPCELADQSSDGRRQERQNACGPIVGDRTQGVAAGLGSSGSDRRPGPTNGFWGDADWLHCRDRRWRPVEPGTFPLAHGASSRMGRLRAYGNAVDAQATAHFIASFLDAEADGFDLGAAALGDGGLAELLG